MTFIIFLTHESLVWVHRSMKSMHPFTPLLYMCKDTAVEPVFTGSKNWGN